MFQNPSQPELENVDQNEEDAREEEGSYSSEEESLCRKEEPFGEEHPTGVRECRSMGPTPDRGHPNHPSSSLTVPPHWICLNERS